MSSDHQHSDIVKKPSQIPSVLTFHKNSLDNQLKENLGRLHSVD